MQERQEGAGDRPTPDAKEPPRGSMNAGENERSNEREANERGRFQLTIPLDASGIADRGEKECCSNEPTPEKVELKVAARDVAGNVRSQTVSVDEKGRATATLTFAERPSSLQLFVGPGTASDEELVNLQTLQFEVSARQWANGPQLSLPPVIIGPYHWFWWLRWCRTFVIRGRVLCPDGSPVPGATVCASDVDRFFIWSSTQVVGCATTDINGAFSIRFRWCCGWSPWWWFRHRLWRLNPFLSERVAGVLQSAPQLRLGAIGGAQPSIAVFGSLAGAGDLGPLEQVLRSDVAALDRVRDRLVAQLPPAPDLAALQLWPWAPWRPWWDCTPDIIFRVTQNCVTHVATIVDEDVGDTRWNVPNPLDVTLVAGPQACCVRRPCRHGEENCPGGECIVVDGVCSGSIANVGGNLGAPATPEGYLNPGPVPPDTSDRHRPFAGTVPVDKNPGDLLGVDYLEFEHSANGGMTWLPLPPGAGENFARQYWDTATAAWIPAPFVFDASTFPGHTVLETREHREAVIGGSWDSPGADHFWGSLNWSMLIPIDSTTFADGTYHFRAIGWTDGGGGTLVNRRVLPVCGTEWSNDLVLTFDNRAITTPGLHDPTHACGMGVHLCTVEPDTHILAVRINGTQVDACDTIDATRGTLEIDFMARDTASAPGQPRHLGHYYLESRWGLNSSRTLLDRPGVSLAVLSGGPSGWMPFQSEGNYGTAVAQGALPPDWGGGTFRLTMPVEEAFPVPCCYQLYLRATKRTVVSCQADAHWNQTQYAIGVGVCGRRPPAAAFTEEAFEGTAGSPPRSAVQADQPQLAGGTRA